MSEATTNAPTDPQTLLLRAALQAGAGAADAWRAWLATEDLDDVSGLSFALLPLVSHNLQALGVSEGPLGRLRGVQRQSWYKNQLRLADLAAAANALTETGLAGLVIGDAALAARIYPQPGLRPIEQLDLLVRPADAGAAHTALAVAGWRPAYPARDLARQMAIRPYGLLHHAQRQTLRLHWRLFASDPDPAADALAWDTAVPAELTGAAALAPDAANLLLHACTEGPLRPAPLAWLWLADAATLLRGWSAELNDSAALAGARPVAQANLRQVQAIAGIAALPPALAALPPSAPTPDAPPAAEGGLARLAVAWRRYRQLPRDSQRLFAPLGFAAYVQSWWCLEHLGQLPAAMLRRWRGAPTAD